jgi:hypothetical protein
MNTHFWNYMKMISKHKSMLITEKTQIKITVQYYLIVLGWQLSKTQNSKSWWNENLCVALMVTWNGTTTVE